MSFYNGELKTFDLSSMLEEIQNRFFVSVCKGEYSESFTIIKDKVDEKLKEVGKLYFSFGKREGDYLLCANGKQYKVDDDRSETSEGIFMRDAYFNKYDDINLGFLISYDINNNINIEPALEGESIECRKYEVIENCGDIHNDMKEFIEAYII